MLSLTTRARTGRSGNSLRISSTAAVVMPWPQNLRSVQKLSSRASSSGNRKMEPATSPSCSMVRATVAGSRSIRPQW